MRLEPVVTFPFALVLREDARSAALGLKRVTRANSSGTTPRSGDAKKVALLAVVGTQDIATDAIGATNSNSATEQSRTQQH